MDVLEFEFTTNFQGASTWRKFMIIFSTSWITMSACFSSTLFFSTVTEISADFKVSQKTLEIADAGVLLTFGMSTFVWGPIEKILGRKIAFNGCISTLLVLTIAAAVIPNFEAFVAVRILSGFEGTYFHVAAQMIFAEYFPPSERGMATGFFLAGVVLGSPSGPLVGAIIVTYKSWRVILWLQAAMVALGLVLSLLSIQYSQTRPERSQVHSRGPRVIHAFDPLHILRWLTRPNLLLTDMACGLLSWPQFTLLTIPRHIIEKRFHLNMPILSGLFYLAPACGFVIGTIVGGHLSDMTVKHWIRKRNGERTPEDRLRSGIISFFIIIPGAYLGFGWGLNCDDCSHARLAVPAITTFLVGVGIFDAMTGMNTYCSEVYPPARRDIIASKYLVQYTFSALASGVAVTMIESMGLGQSCIIDVIFVLLSATFTTLVARYGTKMRRWRDEKQEEIQPPQ